MYSKYNGEIEKYQHDHQHRSLQVAENGFYYVINGIKIANYSSLPETIDLNIEDDENVIKMPKRFQQEFEVFRNHQPAYDYENDGGLDDGFDLLPKSPLSTYRTHKLSYQHHPDHYHHKASEFQQHQKQDHQYRQVHQREQRHYHNDHSHHYHYSKKSAYEDVYSDHGIPPPSVHQSSVNNNNNDNNYNKKFDERFIGEKHHHQSLPTTECLQLKSSDQSRPNFMSEQHYQHYYSYFYNQNSRSSKLASSSGRGRKLPVTSKMPFSKKSSHSTESQLIAKYDLISVEANNLMADKNDNDTENTARANYNYVLREKTANNNEVAAFDNGNWHYDSNDVAQVKSAGGDYLDHKSFEAHEYNCQSFSEQDSKAATLFLQQQKNKRKLQTNNAENGGNVGYNNQIPVGEMGIVEGNVNASNIYEATRRHQKQQTSSDKEEISHRHIKLPATPTKSKVSTPVKKCSPPPKNRRVLIYNIQSPRLSRLSASNIRLQRSKFKLHNETKDDSKTPDVDVTSCQKKNGVVDHVQVLNSMSHIKELRKKPCDSSKQIDGNKSEDNLNGNNNNNNDDAKSDDDDDEDFDNVSDFGSSSDSDISSDSEEGYRTYAYKLTHSLDVVSTSPSVQSSINSESESLDNPDALLVPSLFPNVPPYLAFSSNTKRGPEVPTDLYRILKWRVTNVMPRVVRSILANSGMRLLKKTNDWMGVWGKHMKSPCFKTIRPYQKINHLPGSFKIGRKDSCWKNLVKLMGKHGKKDFGFMPKTYIIPNDLKQLRKSWPKYAQKNVKWIIKPPASARGTGIRVVDRWAQIPKRKPLIVQKYIERPLLINGSKFDLRLYVLVTSINPLRVYMYHNGLARFASVKYSDKSDTLNDRCMHLTNYSINKFSSNYSKNEDVNACHGHKWTIKSLWTYLGSRGVRTDLLWAALRSLVLRTILAGENSINNMIRANVESKYSCFELFGFDVLLDADLVPWLLEVNISPSLHSELPLDSHVKAPLVQSVLNTALYNIPPKIPIERQMEIAMEMSLPPGPICYDKRMYINYLSRTEKIKHNTFTRKSMEDRDEYVNGILEHLTPDDVRCLIIAEDELARCSPLERIFPTIDTHKYLKYTEAPRYYNRLLDAWESRYGNNRTEGIHLLRQYCEDKYHLQVPQIPTKKDSSDDEKSPHPISSYDSIV
ncbi:tubulin monoglutamylase TTLL4 isoform X2 [Calliphora vicina]|uniref:tubulin monoglutamylase TTLL4 isoform X2 n=1 Tax=Calliphora vicina TaxID=7373 RepID=UPI00325B8E2E